MLVRAFFRAATVSDAPPPYSTLHLKVFYPASVSGSDTEQNQGVVPADTQWAPFPVVLFFNGINCGPDQYQWLAITLAQRGMVVVTFSWVAENLPGMIALTPGVDLTRLLPQTYGTGPTASALPTLLAALEQMQQNSILSGLLDLQKIILGGHSAGGRVAIESADPNYQRAIVAAFAYAAHTAGVLQLGYGPGTILPLPDALPLLLIGGTEDGVIAHSSDRYGVEWETPATPIVRTFHDGIAGGRSDSYLLVLQGANHFSLSDPPDETTGRSFLETPVAQPEASSIRDLAGNAIAAFLVGHVRHQAEALTQLHQLVADNPLVAEFQCK